MISKTYRVLSFYFYNNNKTFTVHHLSSAVFQTKSPFENYVDHLNNFIHRGIYTLTSEKNQSLW